MAKVDISRVGAGTIELVRDATTGAYSLKNVGFETIDKLSIPDIKTTATTTKTTTDPKTATDITGQGIGTQTQMAFQMSGGDDDKAPDTTGSMLQQAEKTSKMLSDTFDSPEMRVRDRAKVPSPLDIEDPAERLTAQEAAPQEDIGTGVTDFTNYQDAILRGQTGATFERQKKFGDDLFSPGPAFEDRGTQFSRPKEGTIDQASKDRVASDTQTQTRSDLPSPQQRSLGITTVKPDVALDPSRFTGTTAGTLSDPAEKKDVMPEVKPSALETVGSSIRTALKGIKTPGMMLIQAIAGEETAVNKHDKNYFRVRNDGRIAGNPTDNLYSGMNRVSRFGNLEQAGKNRINNLQTSINNLDKTFSRLKRTDRAAFDAKKERMQNKLDKFKSQDKAYSSSLDKKVTTKREAARMKQPGAGGDKSGRGGRSKIVCTMMNESYGFGSFRNKIWLRHSKNLAPEYQIGYHRIFLPLVKKAKTNKVLKKILEHIAIHRTIDIRQEERNKTHLLGRVYRTILEPICYWVGKI